MEVGVSWMDYIFSPSMLCPWLWFSQPSVRVSISAFPLNTPIFNNTLLHYATHILSLVLAKSFIELWAACITYWYRSMVFSACVIDEMLASSPCFIAHSASVVCVKSIPYWRTFTTVCFQIFTSLTRYGLDYLLIPIGIVGTSDGANLHPTPLRVSRYTFW